MRFGVESVFGITSDVLEYTDPWGQGIVLPVLRWHCRKHRAKIQARVKADPLQARALGLFLRKTRESAAAAAKAEKAEPKLVNGEETAAAINQDGSPVAVEVPQEPSASDVLNDCFWQAADEAIEKGQVSVFDLLASQERDLEDALEVIDGSWSGVKGEDGRTDVPFSIAALRELLTCDTVVAPGHEHAGETIGDALVKGILAFSRSHTETRQQYLEAAEKNSEGSSAGA